MLYEVRVAANKGLGLFAIQSIPRGTRILAEGPLIALRQGQRPSDILSHARQLDKNDREQLLALSWHPGSGVKRIGRWGEALGWAVRDRYRIEARIAQEGDDKSNEKISSIFPGRIREISKELNEAVQILSIFRSNSFNLMSSAISVPAMNSAIAISKPATADPPYSPPYELALFPAIARINHSCIPNAQANYHPHQQTFNVYSTRDIVAGEEVSINYLPEHGQLRDRRIAALEEGYGFTCNCPACDLDTEKGQQGERNRKQMQDRLKQTRALFADNGDATETADVGYGADGMPETSPRIKSQEEQQRIDALKQLPENELQDWLCICEIEILSSMLDMYRNEGIVGREVASMHYHIAQLQWRSGHHENAISNAEAGMRLEEDCLGVDHPEYLEARAFVKRLKESDHVRSQTTQLIRSDHCQASPSLGRASSPDATPPIHINNADLVPYNNNLTPPKPQHSMSTLPNNLLIDVRTPTEFSTGALSNDLYTAINIEYQSIAQLSSIYQALGIDVGKSDNITLYCRSGRRSNIALQTLKELGYLNVRDIGGFEEAHAVLKREELGRKTGADELVEERRREREGEKKQGRLKAFGTLLEGLKGLE
ncbi:hypothetical protein N0V90_009006 [Kalmusia sp. IMI 367209]|nr:hypothetical protein N0V90_009006 [Kalmusia sp. IMI 367209]